MSALSDTILIHYGFESGALTTDDKSGLTLTNNNTVTSVAGKVGNAALFSSGASQYFSLADNATISLGGTPAYWAYAVNLANKTNSGKTFIAKDDTGGPREYFQKFVCGTDRFVFDTWTADGDVGNVRLTLDSFGSPAVDTWYWLQWWLDGTNMYGCVNNGTIDQIAAPGAGWDGNEPLLFGSLALLFSWYMDGMMDHFLFSKTIPSADDRAWLYNSGNLRTWAEIVTGPTPPATARPTHYYGYMIGTA
jgi:hypothetical protein